MAAEAAEEMEAAEEVEEGVAVEEVHIHVFPGTKVFVYNEKFPCRRKLVIHYYVWDLVEARKRITGSFLEFCIRSYTDLRFRSIVFTVHYMRSVEDYELLEFPQFAGNRVEGCTFDGNLIDRHHLKTSFSRIDSFERMQVESLPVRALALGTIVYDPMVKAQGVHYRHELLYYLSEEPRALTAQEWQCLGHLKRGHDSNFITFVFKEWPMGQKAGQKKKDGTEKADEFHDQIFQRTVRGKTARRMAAAVGFQIREHMAFIYESLPRPVFGRAFRSLHGSDDIVTPPSPLGAYSGRHPDLRLEHHHVYHVYPNPGEVPGEIDPPNVLDFPETNPAFAPHLKVVLHLFYHYPPDFVFGFGRQDVETLRQFMFDAPPVDNINRKYHRVVIHPVMYSRPIRSFLQSRDVSLVNLRPYHNTLEMNFGTSSVELKRVTLYIYPGTCVFCPFPRKPFRKSRERHLNLVYFVSDLEASQFGLDSMHIQKQLKSNFDKMSFSRIHISITYMCRPRPGDALIFAPHRRFEFPHDFDPRSDITKPGMTHLSKTTFVQRINPDDEPTEEKGKGKRKGKGKGKTSVEEPEPVGLYAYGTGEGFSDPIEAGSAPYLQDCLIYLTSAPSALTTLEWKALRRLRRDMRGKRSRVTFVFKPFLKVTETERVVERVMGPAAQMLANRHGFEIQPHVAYPLTTERLSYGRTVGCLFHSIQKIHENNIPPKNRTNLDYYKKRRLDLIEFHYSYHMYHGVDGKMVPLNASLLPYRKRMNGNTSVRIPADRDSLMFLHLFFHYPKSINRDEAFEQHTIQGLQKYVITAARPQAKYHELKPHVLEDILPPPPPPPPSID